LVRSSRVYNSAAQVERTVLAWMRTALALAANGALVAREGVVGHSVAAVVGGVIVVSVAGTIWITLGSLSRLALRRHAGHLVAGRKHVAAAAAAVIIALSLGELALELI
jgi:uncharacterized membrane protein YidH (DUF202 family)